MDAKTKKTETHEPIQAAPSSKEAPQDSGRGKEIAKKVAWALDPFGFKLAGRRVKQHYEMATLIFKVIKPGFRLRDIGLIKKFVAFLAGDEIVALAQDKEYIKDTHADFIKAFKAQGLTAERLRASYNRMLFVAYFMFAMFFLSLFSTASSFVLGYVTAGFLKLSLTMVVAAFYLLHTSKLWSVRNQVLNQGLWFAFIRKNKSLFFPRFLPDNYRIRT